MNWIAAGIPIGILARIAKYRFIHLVLNPRLWLSSCTANVIMWLIVPETMYVKSSSIGNEAARKL